MFFLMPACRLFTFSYVDAIKSTMALKEGGLGRPYPPNFSEL